MRRERRDFLLVVIDVDGLKQVNDSLGHAAEDDLLRRFASGFAAGTAPLGPAHRLSGDEFALLRDQGPEAAERLVGEVTRGVQETYPAAGASVGAARQRPGESARARHSRADRAMYRHKNRTQEEGPAPDR